MNAPHVVVRYPTNAQQHIYLRGDGCNLSWNKGTPLRPYQLPTHHWSLKLPLECNTTNLTFKALLDDTQWALGANARYATNATYAPWFASHAGRYEVVNIAHSRDAVVYVPPSFDENPYASYGQLLLLQDGENVFDDATAFGGRSWRAAPTLDAEVSSGRVGELLVAAVYNSAARIDEYTWIADPQYGGGKADAYLDWLEAAVVPQLRRSHRLARSAKISIGGSSLGGLLACYAAWTRPHVYAAAACMSPSFWWAGDAFAASLMRSPTPVPVPRPTVYLDVGSAETRDMLSSMQEVRARFAQLQWPDDALSYYLAAGGTHDEASWGARFAQPLRALFGVAGVDSVEAHGEAS